jgi:hypothetical protein
MFKGASKFNQTLLFSNTEKVKSMVAMFDNATNFNNDGEPLTFNIKNETEYEMQNPQQQL